MPDEIRQPHVLWLVEELSALGVDFPVVTWHGAFWDKTPQGAMDQASAAIPDRGGVKGLLFGSFELRELEPGYRWIANDGSVVWVEVRKVDRPWRTNN